MLFGVPESQNSFNVGDKVDILFTVGVNSFNGHTDLQLILNDIRYAEDVYNKRISDRSKLFAVLNGELYKKSEDIYPERQDFVSLYRLILHSLTDIRLSMADTTATKLFAEKLPPESVPSFVKYRIMLEVFNELDIFKVEYLPIVSDKNGDRWSLPEDICVITRGSAEKVNLDDSKIMKALREQMRD